MLLISVTPIKAKLISVTPINKTQPQELRKKSGGRPKAENEMLLVGGTKLKDV